MLVCVFLCASCTRDRGCSAHPVFPAPSAIYEGGKRRKARADRAARTWSHILSRHRPRKRAIQYAAANRLKQWRLWNTGRIQPVVATPFVWLTRRNSSRVSAGVFQPRVFRGLVLSARATASRSSALCALRSVPFGKYWRSNPLVFSLVPRCHGL